MKERLVINTCICGKDGRHQRIGGDSIAKSIVVCKGCLRSSPVFTTRDKAVEYWNKINKHLLTLNLEVKKTVGNEDK